MKFEELVNVTQPWKNYKSIIFVKTEDDKQSLIQLLLELEKAEQNYLDGIITLSNGFVIKDFKQLNALDASSLPDNEDRLEQFISVWTGDIGDPEYWEGFNKWEPVVAELVKLVAPIEIKVLCYGKKVTWYNLDDRRKELGQI